MVLLIRWGVGVDPTVLSFFRIAKINIKSGGRECPPYTTT
jgi:hypothetical protein